MDTADRTFFTYIKPDDHDNNKLRLELVPHMTCTMRSILGNAGRNMDKDAVKKIRSFTYATSEEMKTILDDAKLLNQTCLNHVTLYIAHAIFAPVLIVQHREEEDIHHPRQRSIQ